MWTSSAVRGLLRTAAAALVTDNRRRARNGVDGAPRAGWCDMDISDMRAVRQASQSLENDVNNLRLRIERSAFPDAEPDGKVWSFQGSSGQHVLVDRRNPTKFDTSNARYTASSWKIGHRSTEINPVTGTHSYDTGNLYRTVHWRDIGQGFGLNGYFTNDLARAGMWKNEGGQPAPHSPARPTLASAREPPAGGGGH